jgi:hypothetical protein
VWRGGESEKHDDRALKKTRCRKGSGGDRGNLTASLYTPWALSNIICDQRLEVKRVWKPIPLIRVKFRKIKVKYLTGRAPRGVHRRGGESGEPGSTCVENMPRVGRVPKR